MLRRDVRFAGGAPLTAEDVVFSHRCARSEGLPGSSMVRAARMVQSLEAVAPHVVVARGLDPHWSARAVFTTGVFVVSRSAVLEKVRALAARKGVAVPEPFGREFGALLAELPDLGPGSGPYVLAPRRAADGPWAAGVCLDLVQNHDSWRRAHAPEAWNLAGLRHVFVVDPQAQVALARRQQLDWLAGDVRALAADPSLAAHYRVVVYDPSALGPLFVAWNCRRPALADPRVRSALGLLFDRVAIAREVLHGDAEPAAGWFDPGAPETPADVAPLRHDPAAAAALLAAAGVGPGFRVEILAAAGDPMHRRVLELAQPSFAAAGVELVARLVEGGVLRDRLQRHDFEGLLALKYHPDPWIDPWPHFHGSQTGVGGQNWMGFADEEVNRLLDAARTERDPERRAAHYRAFVRRVHELQPVAFLVHPRAALLLHRRFRSAEVGPTGLSPELWWVPPEEQLHGR